MEIDNIFRIILVTLCYIKGIRSCSTNDVTELTADEREKYIEFGGGNATSATKSCYHWRITAASNMKVHQRLMWVVVYGRDCRLDATCLKIYDGYNDSSSLSYYEMRRDSENMTGPLTIAVPDNRYVYIKFNPGAYATMGSFRLQYWGEEIDSEENSKKTSLIIIGVLVAITVIGVVIICVVMFCKQRMKRLDRKLNNPYQLKEAWQAPPEEQQENRTTGWT